MNAAFDADGVDGSKPASTHTVYDSFPYLVGGGVLGAVAAIFAAMSYGLVLAFANSFSGGEICGEGFASWLIVLLSVTAVVVVFAVGTWLFRLRRWIGTKADPEDLEHVRWLRNRFTVGTMTVYCVMAPFVWLMAAASANCVGG